MRSFRNVVAGVAAFGVAVTASTTPWPVVAGATGIVGVVSLAACANTEATASTYVGDAQAVVTSLQTLLANPKVAAAIPAPTLAVIRADLQTAQTAAADLQTQLTTSTTSTTSTQAADVRAIANLVNAVVSVASSLPLPAPAPTILTAAATLLPLIESAVGIAGATTTTAPAILGAPGSMSPAAARLVLAGAGA